MILREFLGQLDSRHKHVMEFRHSSWWNEATRNLLTKHQVTFCTVSGLKMPSQIMNTSNIAYFRFHGPGQPYASQYSREQLKKWALSIQNLIRQEGVEEVFCYFNNDYYGYALEDAQRLRQLLELQEPYTTGPSG